MRRTAIITSWLLTVSVLVQAQTTLNYQGTLNANGAAASGVYDFRFSLINAPSVGAPVIGGPSTNLAVVVSNGAFSAPLDFGSAAFTGNGPWLSVEVKASGTTNDFTLMLPFQAFPAQAYAISAARITGTVSASQITGTLPASILNGVNGSGLVNLNPNAFLPRSFVADANLSLNVQFQDHPLYASSVGNEVHQLWSSGTISGHYGTGSTLSLVHYGPDGYADMNFFTAPTLSQALGNPTLRFALGVGMPGSGIYSQPYIEMYSGEAFYFVGSGSIYGGVQGGTFNLVWYRDGTTNTPFFEVDRASGTVKGNGAGLTNLNAGGLTTNISVALPGGKTGTLVFSNGVLISSP